MFDWQAIAVALIILGALFYVARRALRRLRSFRLGGGKGGAGACASQCGKCGDEDETPSRPAPTLVQINSPRRTSARDTR